MHDNSAAAGQNPIARVNVNCEYPRNKNSSKKPTSKKKTAQNTANLTARKPWIDKCPKSNARTPYIAPSSSVIPAIPQTAPTQNNFPNANRPGNP